MREGLLELAVQNSFLGMIAFILVVGFFVFWVWTLVDMFTSRKLKKTEKGVWFLLFFVLSIFTPFVWLFVRK